MIVDASASVAIICGESDGTELSQRLAAAERRFTLPIVLLEACMVLVSRLDIAPSQANALFDNFLDEANLSIVAIDNGIGSLAVACFEAFAKEGIQLDSISETACPKPAPRPIIRRFHLKATTFRKSIYRYDDDKPKHLLQRASVSGLFATGPPHEQGLKPLTTPQP
ncbi:PIN domain-containing protein [Methylocystis iwaonis]|uniref:PIN domain-containing protein n=1 Tax=Methylocystis iwaonis TaxID=2885079 RepID=UPI0039B494C0